MADFGIHLKFDGSELAAGMKRAQARLKATNESTVRLRKSLKDAANAFGSLGQGIKQAAALGGKTNGSLSKTKQKVVEIDEATKRMRASMGQAAQAFGQLGKAVSAKSSLDANLRAAAASGRTLEQQLATIPNKMSDVGNSGVAAASRIRLAFATLGIGLVIGKAVQSINRLSELKNQLRIVTTGTQDLTDTTARLYEIANRTRTSFVATSRTYTRIALASRELGITNEQTAQFTESLNKAVILSGATAREAEAGMLQLSQGLASGSLRGDELRSVLEQLPVVSDVIAKHMKVTRGELRKLGADGKISAHVVVDAFAAAKESLDNDFGKTVPTLAQSMALLGNKIYESLSAFDEATGFTNKFAAAVRFVIAASGVLLKVLRLLVNAAIVLLVFNLPVLIGMFHAWASVMVGRAIPAIIAFNAKLRANPLGAVITLVQIFIAVMATFGDSIANVIHQLNEEAETNLTLRNSISALIPIYGDVVLAKKRWREATQRNIEKLEGEIEAMQEHLKNMAISADAREEYIEKTLAMNNALFKVEKGLKEEREEIGLSRQALVALRLERKLNTEELKSGIRIFGVYREYLVAMAVENERLREAEEKLKASRAKGKNDRKSTLAAFRALLGSLRDVTAATFELQDAQKLLNKAQGYGLITLEQQLGLEQKVTDKLMDRLDPLGEVDKRLREQFRLQLLSADEREKEIRFLTEISALEAAYGREILPDEAEGIRNLIELFAKLTEIQKRLEDQEKARLKMAAAMEKARLKEIARIAQLRAGFERNMRLKQAEIHLQNLELQGRGSLAEARRTQQSLAEKGLVISEQEVQALAKLNDTLESNKIMYGFIRDAGVNAFGGIRDSLIEFIVDGTNSFEEMAEQMIRTLAKLSLKLLLFQALKAGMSAGGFGGPELAARLAGFAQGGSFTVGGSGGTDSQLVAFRASPDETVTVTKPNQAAPAGIPAASPTVNVGVNNVLSDADLARGINTMQGERALLNRISGNPAMFRRALGVD